MQNSNEAISKVKILIAQSCMTIGEVSQKSGLAVSTVCNAVQGKKLSLKTVGKLARALGVDVTEIM
ncbi:helix-turn-helix transcriptional regulator [Neobittarella massiliensis]|uniref:Helix-turn-helix transcriptional regulator n=1 Tax=Neobittarella massiliensis (ex Bilen et al. 2018) TaxID=2041842 RepID=A0A8J6IPC5_9FIRM|nr:helix-turn-helix transcriptional regulator [Neobittarella massiliensis]